MYDVWTPHGTQVIYYMNNCVNPILHVLKQEHRVYRDAHLGKQSVETF